MKNYLTEVTQRCLDSHHELVKQNKLKDQSHYKTNLKLLGLNVPTLSNLSKIPFSFSNQGVKTQFNIWEYVWHESPYFEVKSFALGFTFKIKNEELFKVWNRFQKWAKILDNWAHSDGISSNIAGLLENYPKEIFTTLQKWNNDKNPWLRRQSIVGLLYYTQSRKKVLPAAKMLPLVKNLLDDKDYYVQKGVGWTLREIGNVYPDKTWEFLCKHVPIISVTAFSPAIEKLDKAKKEELKRLRKESRQKMDLE